MYIFDVAKIFDWVNSSTGFDENGCPDKVVIFPPASFTNNSADE